MTDLFKLFLGILASRFKARATLEAENLVLRLIADRAGLPASAGGCFVSGGSAANRKSRSSVGSRRVLGL